MNVTLQFNADAPDGRIRVACENSRNVFYLPADGRWWRCQRQGTTFLVRGVRNGHDLPAIQIRVLPPQPPAVPVSAAALTAA